MNSMSSSTKLLAVFLCGAALAGCKAVEDSSGSAVFPNPANLVAINGDVSGLSATRPVVLKLVTTTPPSNGTSTAGNVTTTTKVSFRGTNVLRFGSVAQGSTYAITVDAQPYGRNCTVANGTGTANAEVNNVVVTCAQTNVPRYTLSVNINSTLAANRPEGFAVKLTTEEGSQTIVPAANQTLVTFTLPILYPGALNPPSFNYTVTATNTAGGTTNNCNVSSGTGALIEPPNTGSPNVTTPTVNSCLYTLSAIVRYSPTPACPSTAPTTPLNTVQPGTLCTANIGAQTVAPAVGTGGVQLGLKSQITGADILTTPVTVSAFNDTTANTVTTLLPSNSSALYELYVKTQPTGQFCIVVGGGTVNLVNSLANVTSTVRCRDVPVAANQLKGVYQLDPPTVDTGTGATLATPLVQQRAFLTFFTNGTFIYGTHVASVTAGGVTSNSSGIEHGFYNYNPTAGTLQFTIHTDTSGTTANTFTQGLSGRPGYGTFTAGSVTAQNVTKTAGAVGVPGKLSMRFGQLTPAPVTGGIVVNYVPTLTFTEPRQTLGRIQGAWTTADSKRVFVYDDNTYYGFHAGVNGAPNLQDACFAILNTAAPSGFYTRRGGGTGCMGTAAGATPYTNGTVSTSIIDVPDANPANTVVNTTAPYIPGFAGRLPGSQSTTVLATSPVNYTVTAGTPDTLVIQDTLNAIPIGAPITFQRATTY